MGLLTDPGMERCPLPDILELHHRPLCALLYVCGIVWFLALAHNSLNHETYFSENALLPGLVRGDFQGDSEALRYLQSLQEEGEQHPSSVPHPWLVGQFSQLGLDTYTHTFTLEYPMGRGKNFTGRNVYGILRASRGSSTEALVVAAPYRPVSSLLQGTAPSIALMLAMANFFSKQVYWAKDIIFLVTEHEQLGAQAWLEAYHRPHTAAAPPHAHTLLHHGDLEGRAGAIQAAINLEIYSSEVGHLDVRVEGLNGQLPNLDLVNLIHRLCQRESVPHTFKNRPDHPWPDSFRGWLHQLTTLVAMVTSQASGVPNGNHGLFHRYGVAAVTVAGMQREGRRRGVSLHQLGRVLEGVCRSLNNLLERFHQSFFFYLLPATNRYISIGVYMPPFGLIAGGVLVKALALWYSTGCTSAVLEQRRAHAQKQKKRDQEGKKEAGKQEEEQEGGKEAKKEEEEEEEEEEEKEDIKIEYGLLHWVPAVVMVHGACVALSSCPIPLSRLGLALALGPEDSVALGVMACCLAMLVLPPCVSRYTGSGVGSWEVLKIYAVLELGVMLFAGAVYNFSLALIIAVLYTPVSLLASPSPSRLGRALKSALLLLVHPLSLLFLSVLLDTHNNFPEVNVTKLLWKTFVGSKRALMYSVVDAMIYSNWVFDVAAVCLLPVWTMLWQIVHHPPQPQPHTSQTKQKTKSA